MKFTIDLQTYNTQLKCKLSAPMEPGTLALSTVNLRLDFEQYKALIIAQQTTNNTYIDYISFLGFEANFKDVMFIPSDEEEATAIELDSLVEFDQIKVREESLYYCFVLSGIYYESEQFELENFTTLYRKFELEP